MTNKEFRMMKDLSEDEDRESAFDIPHSLFVILRFISTQLPVLKASGWFEPAGPTRA